MRPSTEIRAAALTVIAVGTYGIIATVPSYAPDFPSVGAVVPNWVWFGLDGALVAVGIWRLMAYRSARASERAAGGAKG